MPQNKDLKRLTRSRMAKTGESYTSARSVLLAKKARATAPPPVEKPPQKPAEKPGYAALAGMSDETIAARTGCTWEKWVRSLDAHDMASKPHREIAQFVHEKYKIDGWWAQSVTVGYERIKGLREKGQRRGGSYEASKSKTLPVGIARLYRAFRDQRLRSRWLPGVELTVRTAIPERSMRITWDDGTSVELWFTAKGDEKSQVSVQHVRLASKADAEARKAFWAARLGALAELLASA
jgi:uncharacterized protein YndB with AHSA1/START domain